MSPRTGKAKKDRSYCCVPQCTSQACKDPSLSFHLFPNVNLPGEMGRRNEKRKLQWILALKIGKNVSKRMPVCSKHFKKTDYILPDAPKKRPHLKSTAVPSLFLPVWPVDNQQTNEKAKANQKAKVNLKAKANGKAKEKELREEQSLSKEEKFIEDGS